MTRIDFHVHPVQVQELHDRDTALDRAVRGPFGLQMPPQPLETLLLHLDAGEIDKAVMLPLDCTTAHGTTIVSNEQVAWLAEQSDRLIPFASVDPMLPDAPKSLEHAVKSYGARGLKLDPSLQQFAIDDRDHAYPVYRTCVELGIPILIHCGMSWAPTGLASMAHPLLLERVIHDFPTLPFVIAHMGWPWVRESAMLAIKHRHICLDTSVLFSGTPTDSVSRAVEEIGGVDTLDRSLSKQIVFGSNYPRVDPKRAVWAVEALNLRPRLAERIFCGNATRLLGLEKELPCAR